MRLIEWVEGNGVGRSVSVIGTSIEGGLLRRIEIAIN